LFAIPSLLFVVYLSSSGNLLLILQLPLPVLSTPPKNRHLDRSGEPPHFVFAVAVLLFVVPQDLLLISQSSLPSLP
jgi:hypothetical protein